MTRRRGPNLLPSYCKECNARLTWRNHSRYQGRFCREHYNLKKKIEMGLARNPNKPKERTDDSRGAENI